MLTPNFEAYSTGGGHKEFTIAVSDGTTITNEKLLQDAIVLEEALCSENNLKYGSCEASQISLQIANAGNSYEGKTLQVSVTMNNITTKYGTFKVQSDKPTADRLWRKVTAYDAMYDILNADVMSWYNGLTFPMTIKALRDSFFEHLGIYQKNVTLINDSFVTDGGFAVSGSLSGKTIITAICEFNGVFGHINRNGVFDYVSLSGTGFDCPPYENGSVTYEDYVTAAITRLTMRGSTNDVGVSVGTDGNEYIITGNPLIYGKEGTAELTTAATALLNKIKFNRYTPYSVTKTIGNPCVELGDSILIMTSRERIQSYVIKRTLTGIQALRDAYSATGDEKYPGEVNSLDQVLKRTLGRTNELERTVDETKSTITNLTEELHEDYSTTTETQSMIDQTAEGITTEVTETVTNYIDENTYTKTQTDSKIQQSADSITSTVSETYTAKGDAIKTDTLWYLATSYDSGVTRQDSPSTYGSWTTTIQQVTETKKYLWTYHQYTYADGTNNHYSNPVITGVYGDKGQQGQPGQQGETGVGISSITPLYWVSDSSTAPTKPQSEVTLNTANRYNQWNKATSALTDTYTYLFVCDQVLYDDGHFQWTDVVEEKMTSSLGSEFRQTKESFVLSVNNNGEVALVKLENAPGSPSSFIVKAKNISLDGYRIDLSASDHLTITGGNLTLDAAGNVEFKGSIKSGSTISGAVITGGSINISSGKFLVDANGNLTASNATINGGSINISSGKFLVDANGNLTASSATINGGSINISSGRFTVDTSGNLIANSATIYGTIHANAGDIGGLAIDSSSIYTGGATYSVAEGQWVQADVTMGGEPVYKSDSNYKVDSNVARTTITISGYDTFALKAVSHGEKNYDYMCIGQVDVNNISAGQSSETTTIKKSFYGLSTASVRIDQGAADESITLTDSSIYTGIVFTGLGGSTHTIEVIYSKDTSQSWGSDRGYFYVDKANCVAASTGGNGFKLASSDFSRSIGGTSLTNLRMALGTNFGVTSAGVLYANGANLTGTIKTGTGTNFVELKNGNITMGTNSSFKAVLASSPYTEANLISFTNNGGTPPTANMTIGNPGYINDITIDVGSTTSGRNINLKGNVYISGYYMGRKEATPSTSSPTVDSTFRSIMSTTLPTAGTYVVTAVLHTSAQGNLLAGVGTSSGSASVSQRAADSDWLTITRIISVTASTTIYLVAKSSVSTTAASGTKIEYVKVN